MSTTHVRLPTPEPARADAASGIDYEADFHFSNIGNAYGVFERSDGDLDEITTCEPLDIIFTGAEADGRTAIGTMPGRFKRLQAPRQIAYRAAPEALTYEYFPTSGEINPKVYSAGDIIATECTTPATVYVRTPMSDYIQGSGTSPAEHR
jgi:hypothetical protein